MQVLAGLKIPPVSRFPLSSSPLPFKAGEQRLCSPACIAHIASQRYKLAGAEACRPLFCACSKLLTAGRLPTHKKALL